jgi:Serine dehydrogenase proteinase
MAQRGYDEEESWSFIPAAPTCQVTYLSDGQGTPHRISEDGRKPLVAAGSNFLDASGGDSCLLLAGPLVSTLGNEDGSTENAIARCCRDRFGYPGRSAASTIDVVLDTYGGSLDSAYKIVLLLSRFAERIRLFVPRRAKSAGTLIAIGAHELHMSPFAELGPLDTQIVDPRNPTELVSALDCYQSVDYVRAFGLGTLRRTLVTLAKEMQTGIPLSELVNTAEHLSAGSIASMLAQVRALDFGGWGRTLKIGELYAKSLLTRVGRTPAEAGQIAYQLVYGYTHHPFPIDLDEAARVGLRPQQMSEQEYTLAAEMLGYCAKDDLFVGFVDEDSGSRRQEVSPGPEVRGKVDHQPAPTAELAARDEEDHAIARPHGQVTGAVEEGQQFAVSDSPSSPTAPNN